MIYRFKKGLVNLPLANNETVSHIFPCLIHGEQEAMEVLFEHFNPYLKDWIEFDELQKKCQENIKDESLDKKH
jgi:E3 ubiquitin-protein ligase UBR4